MEHLYFPDLQCLECQVHVAASSCFLAFVSVCTLQFLLTADASSMQMIYAVFFKFYVPFSSVLWTGFLSLLSDIYLRFVSSLCGSSKNPVPQKFIFMFCVLDTFEDESVIVFEGVLN